MTEVKRPIFVSLDEEGLDDFFKFKNLYEKEVLNMEDGHHVPYSKFIEKYLGINSMAFSYAKTQDAVAFNILHIGDVDYVVHTPNEKETLDAFKSALEEVSYDIKSLPDVSPKDIVNGIEMGDFFTLGTTMKLVRRNFPEKSDETQY